MVRIPVLATTWFLSGALVSWSLGFSDLRAIRVGLIALISALVYLAVLILPITYNRRLFFKGPEPEAEFYLHIGCLWYIPLAGVTWVPFILILRFLF